MTGIAELLRGVGSQASESPPPLWDVPGVEPDFDAIVVGGGVAGACLLYTSPSPRDLSTSRMPSSA